MDNYIPEKGDIVFLDFNPIRGHEQAGRRPALIVSPKLFSVNTGLAIVCPITNTIKDFPLHVMLDNTSRTTGVILCEHIKSIDFRARNVNFVEKISYLTY